MGELVVQLEGGVIWHACDQYVMAEIDLPRGPNPPDGSRHVFYRFTRTYTSEGDDIRSVGGPVVTSGDYWVGSDSPESQEKSRKSALDSFHQWLHEQRPPKPRGLTRA